MNKKQIIGNTFLLMTAIIWGLAFVAQRVGMDYVGPLTFTGSRFWLATLVLIPVVYFNDRSEKKALTDSGKKEITKEEAAAERKKLLTAGIICGTILFIASILQQFGLVFTSAGKTGFITALYIIIVPVFGLFLKRRLGIKGWIGVVFGVIGLYMLTITESFTIAKGDFVVLIGAFFWAGHVLAIDFFVSRVNSVKLALTQFAVVSILGTITMFIFENPDWSSLVSCAVPILYSGILSGGVAFTFQILGQRNTSPTVAALILSMEAVFGAIFGFLILEEIMTSRELLGCVLMFAAIVISQLPNKNVAEVSVSEDQR